MSSGLSRNSTLISRELMLDYESCAGKLIAKTQAEEEERQSASDAEKNWLNLNAQDGKKIVIKGQLSGTLKDFKQKMSVEVGVTKEYAELLETHLRGYELEPDTKIMRNFTKLCEVIACYSCIFEGLTGE